MDDPRDQLDFNFVADDLLEFPRDLGEEGWFQFTNERKAALLRVEKNFHIVLNQRVRLRLRGRDDEIVGKIVLDSLLFPSSAAEVIELRIGNISFVNTDIDEFQPLEE